MLEITSNAIQEFKRALKGNEGKTIRIYSIMGGCCGPSVGMAIVDKGEADDKTITSDGLVVYVEKRASTALDGVTIDYIDEPGRKGFSMNNPANDGCCG